MKMTIILDKKIECTDAYNRLDIIKLIAHTIKYVPVKEHKPYEKRICNCH